MNVSASDAMFTSSGASFGAPLTTQASSWNVSPSSVSISARTGPSPTSSYHPSAPAKVVMMLPGGPPAFPNPPSTSNSPRSVILMAPSVVTGYGDSSVAGGSGGNETCG